MATALRDALPAAHELGLDSAAAEAVLHESAERLGLAPDVYVLALVGGTGVGKSTLLNALAGEMVSPAGPLRPTTASPVAWVPADSVDRVGPLLARLGVVAPRTHAGPGLGRVVVLDLPDLDSVELGHRVAVEEILPRVDVVAWVTDPEKYADAVLHDGFLRRWLPRLDRQIVVLNKVDRLNGDATARVVRDLAGRIAAEMPATGGHPPQVITTSAEAGESGVAELRRWVVEAADAKAVVAARLAAAARAELADLAVAAGVADGMRPLLSVVERAAAIDQAAAEVMRVVDTRGAETRAVAATRANARRRGTGPAGLLTSTLLRLAGRGGGSAQPAEYLGGWRERGGLASAGEAVRAAVLNAIGGLPAPLRGRYAAAIAEDLDRRLGVAIDRAVANRAVANRAIAGRATGRQGDIAPPASRWWPLLGLLQTANQLVLAATAAWIVVWFISRPQVPDVQLPFVGSVPAPLVLVAGALIIGYILARFLSIHAGWIGRRWARRMTVAVAADVRRALAETAFMPVDQLDAARTRIADQWGRVAD